MAETTFRQRLTLQVTALCLALLGVTGAGVYLGARTALRTNLDSALHAIARAELASALDGPNGSVHVHNEPPTSLSLASDSYEKVALIEDFQGDRVAQTDNLANGPALALAPDAIAAAHAGRTTLADTQRGGVPYRAIYYPLVDNNRRPLVAVCAVPQLPLQHALDLLGKTVLGALLLGGVAAHAAARRLARRLTAPLEALASDAHAIPGAQLSDRLPERSPDAELTAVTQALNGLLARQEAAFQVQRQFVTDASHELRSPLSNLKGTIEVALRRPRTAAEYQETLSTALHETDRLARLANELLLLSRAEGGQMILERQPCDLSRIACGAASAHTARAQATGVRVTLDTPPEATLEADPDRLRQVIDNLLDNALRYAPAGSEVVVRVAAVESAWEVSVSDAGPGIAPEHQAQVFERFWRADPARARASGGAGLGLAIARAIVEAHGGSVRVASVPGHGATFTLTLPASPRSSLATPSATP